MGRQAGRQAGIGPGSRHHYTAWHVHSSIGSAMSMGPGSMEMIAKGQAGLNASHMLSSTTTVITVEVSSAARRQVVQTGDARENGVLTMVLLFRFSFCRSE